MRSQAQSRRRLRGCGALARLSTLTVMLAMAANSRQDPPPQPGGVFGEGCVAAVVQTVFDAQWSRSRASRKAGLAWAGVSAVTARTVSQETFAPQAAAHAVRAGSPQVLAARQAFAAAVPRTGAGTVR